MMDAPGFICSEKRFYQKLRDLFKTSSSDYDGTARTAKTFFATRLASTNVNKY